LAKVVFVGSGRGEQLNAVEIEEAISQLADQPFDAENFPYAFLEAFGNKETTIKRLRTGTSNKSDLGGVLQTNNIHIATCDAGQVTKTLTALKDSPATANAKAKYVMATDGVDFEAEELASGKKIGRPRALVTDVQINTLLREGRSMMAIGQLLGVSAATVCRTARRSSE
jgi:transposase-like protein